MKTIGSIPIAFLTLSFLLFGVFEKVDAAPKKLRPARSSGAVGQARTAPVRGGARYVTGDMRGQETEFANPCLSNMKGRGSKNLCVDEQEEYLKNIPDIDMSSW